MKPPSNGLTPAIDSIAAFAKKVVTIAAAVTIVAGAMTWMRSAATRPLSDAQAETQKSITQVANGLAKETRGRTTADSLMGVQMAEIARQISTQQRDRLDLIDVMLAKPGPEREAKLREIRGRWARDHLP